LAGFYLDNDVARELALELQELGHQAIHAHHVALDHARDFEQLLYAVAQNLILVTHNAKDYRLLHGAWIAWSSHHGATWTHPGILIIPQARWTTAECAAELDQIVQSIQLDASLVNQILRWTPSKGWTAWD
jgi:hypothetical protein